MAAPTVDAILVTFNRVEPLAASCRAALEQTAGLRTLIVVDNSPAPVAADVVAELGNGSGAGATVTEVVHTGENLGPPGAHAVGLRRLREREERLDWVLLLDDDDPLPSPEVAERLLRSLPPEGADRIAGVALMGMRFVRPRLLLGGPVDVSGGGLVPADALLGWAAPLYRAGALDDVGGFRPELFWGDDDIELGLRLARNGWELRVAADVYRSLPVSDEKVPGRPRLGIVPPAPRDYYGVRNRIHIGRRYFRARDVAGAITVRALLKPLLNLPRHPVLAARTLRLNARAVVDGLRGRLGRTVPLHGETREERGRSSITMRDRVATFVRGNDGPLGRLARRIRRWQRPNPPFGRASLLAVLPPRSVGAEIGVHRGDLSARLLRRLELRRLHLIDPWKYADSPPHPKMWHGGRTGGSQRNMERRYRGVLRRFERQIADGTVVVHRGMSWDIADEIPDGSLDWAYIDGDHSYEAVKRDIAAYVPKLRPGGVLAGDDYGERSGPRAGVTRAVDELVAFGRLEVVRVSEDRQWAVRAPG